MNFHTTTSHKICESHLKGTKPNYVPVTTVWCPLPFIVAVLTIEAVCATLNSHCLWSHRSVFNVNRHWVRLWAFFFKAFHPCYQWVWLKKSQVGLHGFSTLSLSLLAVVNNGANFRWFSRWISQVSRQQVFLFLLYDRHQPGQPAGQHWWVQKITPSFTVLYISRVCLYSETVAGTIFSIVLSEMSCLSINAFICTIQWLCVLLHH